MLAAFVRLLRKDYWEDVITDCEQARGDSETRLGRVSVQKRLATTVLLVIACLMFVRFAGNEAELGWAVNGLKALGLPTEAEAFRKLMDPKNANGQIWRKVWWAGARVTGYGLLPALLGPRMTGLSLAELGLGFGDLRKHARTYGFLFAVMMPAIFLASFGAGFQAKYPYYKLAANEALWPRFVLWELLYIANFVGVELFFRGFSIRALRPYIGYSSIFLMMVPYAMIHFGKPLPEAVGSIITGFVLGTLSVKHRSIWGGVFLHVSAACSMDLYSLWHQGRL